MAEFTGTIPLLPGEYEERDFNVPAKIKTGEYVLEHSAKDLESGKNFNENSLVNISGLIVSLNSQTLNDIYFNTDLVSGKSDINFGSEGIDNGVWQAKIIRYIKSTGVEQEEPGDFIPYNYIHCGYISGNILYLVTGKGMLPQKPGLTTWFMDYTWKINWYYPAAWPLMWEMQYCWEYPRTKPNTKTGMNRYD